MSFSNKKQISKDKIKTINENEKKEASFEEIQKDSLIEKINSKEQQIYDLISKIKTQESKIELLNKEMQEKDLNIYTLEQFYKFQMEEVKNILGFKGDVELLLNKKENSYEYEFAKFMKQTQKDIIKNDNKIIQLKEEIKQIERDNEQLNIFIEIKKNNETMLEILKSIEKNKKIKKDNVQSKIDEEIMVKNLFKKNKYLRKKIEEIKNNINKDSNIIKSLPQSFIINTNNNKIQSNDDINIQEIEMNKKLEKEKEKEDKETQILLNKYLSIMEQNKKELIKGNEYIHNIDNIYLEEIKKYEEELIRLFKLIQKIINIYYKSFDKTYSLILRKEDCDKLLEKELNNLNLLSFPLLFKFIEKNKSNKNNDNNENTSYRNSKKGLKNEYNKLIKKIYSRNNNPYADEDNKKIESLNFINNELHDLDYSYDTILSEKTNLFESIERKKEEQLKNLSEEKLLAYVLSINNFIKDYDNYINKYIYSKKQKKYKKFLEIPENNIKNIETKIFVVNNAIKELVKKQNQMDIVMQVTSQVIQKLRKENFELSKCTTISKSNDKKIKIPNLNMNKIYNNNNYFKKPLSNRNSIKNNICLKNEPNALLTDGGYIKDKYKIYKLKLNKK